MRRAIIFILIVFTFVSCEDRIVGPNIDASVSLSIVNTKGDALLNPSAVGAITEEHTDIYLLKNGLKVRLYQGNLDAAKFFKIRRENDKYWLQMYFDIAEENFKDNKITQYIRYKDGSEDEIIGEFNSNRKRDKVLQQIWINGVAKTKNETSNSGRNPIVLVK